MEFEKKYKHIGNSYLSVPAGWKPIVKKALIDIEKLMWPRWMPKFIKRIIHWLATGGSVVRIKYWWAYNLRTKITGGATIRDIKEKYATLRIDGSFTHEMGEIVERAEKECKETCQDCGSKDSIECVEDWGWWSRYCKTCRDHPRFAPTREVLIEKYEK